MTGGAPCGGHTATVPLPLAALWGKITPTEPESRRLGDREPLHQRFARFRGVPLSGPGTIKLTPFPCLIWVIVPPLPVHHKGKGGLLGHSEERVGCS